MASTGPPLQGLSAWARLNFVDFFDTEVENVPEKGLGLFTTRPRLDDGGKDDAKPFLEVPRQLILSAEAVEDYAKVDQNFRQLLDKVNPQSPRTRILLYLLVHLRHPARGQTPQQKRGVASTPWTDYIKFLPKDVPLPTLWTREEIELLNGTSLEVGRAPFVLLQAVRDPEALRAAVDAKLASLDQEFESVRLLSSELPYWQAYLWEREAAKVEDWALLDAWYRSRCLELPQSGHSMVPCLDLANHSREPNAFYDQTGGGDAVLLPRPGGVTDGGGEITISYGGSKSAAEMLFSYGFIDENSINSEMTLPFQASQDDPLAQAKLHVYEGSPTVRLIRTNGIMGWDSPFVHLAVLNEEDGLEFRIQQDMFGDRQLRVFWQEEDVTSQAADFERLTESHPLSSVFRLRAVAMLEEMVTGQLQSIHNSPIAGTDPSGGSPGFRADCAHAAKTLRETETLLLSGTLADFGHQKTILLADDSVLAYLGLMEATQNEQPAPQPANEEPDFS